MDCFVIMPFAQEFDDVYDVIKSSVESAIPGENIRCFRLDDERHAGAITDELLSAIRGAALCVADSTGSNPNVMWEIGFAMALKKPVVFLHRKDSTMPFDIQHMRSIRYVAGSLSRTLERPLREATAATISHYKLATVSTRPVAPAVLARTFSITGSMNADLHIVESRLRAALDPYLGKDITWMCGSNGVVDEVALDYLGSNGEKVECFGYTKYDTSDNTNTLLDKYGFPFYDASEFQIPDGIEGPSMRDKLFLTKASFHFLIWNGRSSGCAELKKFFDTKKVSYQTVFC